MGELLSLKKANRESLKNAKNRELTPFRQYIDGSEVPFGEKNSNGVYKLNHTTVMNGDNGGYQVDAIFGVYEQRKLDLDFTMYDEHIFVGECPHQDENGKWVTHNEVPNFIRRTSCCEPGFIEPDTPFIVRVIPELRYDYLIRENKNVEEILSEKLYDLQKQIDRCTFKMYLKGLWHRIKLLYNAHLHFVSYTGERTYHFGVEKPISDFSFCYWNDFKAGEKYFCKVTDQMVTRWTFYKDGKLTWKKESWENDHTYCSC